MKLPLSSRLLACCSFVRPGDRVADVGCDHGYLSIHLLQTGVASSMIASDVAEGPLQSAMRNAEKYGVKDRMSFYLSDGLRNIPRDFDCMVCAGMGADTMMSILGAAPWTKDPKYRLILQCQSKRPELRRWLYDNGYAIRRETLAQDGKFYYPIMEVVYAPGEKLENVDSYITPALLRSGSPLLPAFVDRVIGGLETAEKGLAKNGGDRYEEIRTTLEQLRQIRSGLSEVKGECL